MKPFAFQVCHNCQVSRSKRCHRSWKLRHTNGQHVIQWPLHKTQNFGFFNTWATTVERSRRSCLLSSSYCSSEMMGLPSAKARDASMNFCSVELYVHQTMSCQAPGQTMWHCRVFSGTSGWLQHGAPGLCISSQQRYQEGRRKVLGSPFRTSGWRRGCPPTAAPVPSSQTPRLTSSACRRSRMPAKMETGLPQSTHSDTRCTRARWQVDVATLALCSFLARRGG